MTVIESFRMNRSAHNYKMNNLYKMVGISKQGHYKRLKLHKESVDRQDCIIASAANLRLDHKKMGCRKIFDEIKPCGMGRDRTEKLLLDNGFRIPRKRNYRRTTYAGDRFYKNHISGIELLKKDQVYVSDITYIPVGYKDHYYLTLVLDVYSRKITGWSLSSTMQTHDTVYKAFLQATNGMSQDQRSSLIFHSDKGSQYGSDLMKEVFKTTGVTPSMGGKAWENAHAESLNGILKNEYINFIHKKVTLNQATKMMTRWIYLYNNKRPHGSLGNMKPNEFETYVDHLSEQQKPKFKINY